MDRRIGQMGPMAVDPIVGTHQIEMIQLRVSGSWIHQTSEGMNKFTILVLVLIGIVIIIVIILTRGVIGD